MANSPIPPRPSLVAIVPPHPVKRALSQPMLARPSRTLLPTRAKTEPAKLRKYEMLSTAKASLGAAAVLTATAYLMDAMQVFDKFSMAQTSIVIAPVVAVAVTSAIRRLSKSDGTASSDRSSQPSSVEGEGKGTVRTSSQPEARAAAEWDPIVRGSPESPTAAADRRMREDLDRRSAGGWTPLHHAAANGDLDQVRELHRAGADISQMTGGADARDALGLAIHANHRNVVRYLRREQQLSRSRSHCTIC